MTLSKEDFSLLIVSPHFVLSGFCEDLLVVLIHSVVFEDVTSIYYSFSGAITMTVQPVFLIIIIKLERVTQTLECAHHRATLEPIK